MLKFGDQRLLQQLEERLLAGLSETCSVRAGPSTSSFVADMLLQIFVPGRGADPD